MALVLGQKVIVKKTEWKQPVIYTEATVNKVGRKYFTLESEELRCLHRTKFRNEDLGEVTNYTSEYRIYLSLSELVEEELSKVLARYIVSLLTSSYVSLYISREVDTGTLVKMVKVLDPSCELLRRLAAELPSIPGSREYLKEQYGINTEDSQETIQAG